MVEWIHEKQNGNFSSFFIFHLRVSCKQTFQVLHFKFHEERKRAFFIRFDWVWTKSEITHKRKKKRKKKRTRTDKNKLTIKTEIANERIAKKEREQTRYSIYTHLDIVTQRDEEGGEYEVFEISRSNRKLAIEP